MRIQWIHLLLAGSALLSGCAPGFYRSAHCQPHHYGPCNSGYVVASQPCDVTSEQFIMDPNAVGSHTNVIQPGSSAPGIDGRVNSIQNDLDSLKADVGDVQRQNQQIDRKLDRLIDDYVPPK